MESDSDFFSSLLEDKAAQPQGVGDHTERGQRHRGGGHDRRQEKPRTNAAGTNPVI